MIVLLRVHVLIARSPVARSGSPDQLFRRKEIA